MKILLLGDYSNYHACLGQALARRGHQVTVASDGGGWMNTAKSLSLNRPLPGKVGGMVLFVKMILDNRLKGYDIVSLISPSFVTLRPPLLKNVFDRLRRNNGKVFLGSVGTDKALMDFLTSPDCSLRYSEYYSSPGNIYLPNKSVLEADSEWQRGQIADLCEYVYDHVDGVTTALYEYQLAMERRVEPDRLAYVGIPVDLDSKHYIYKDVHEDGFDGKLNLFLGRHSRRKKFKGTDRLEAAARRVVDEFPDKACLTIIEDRPYSEYIGNLKKADIVLDQLYSYSPATNALLAMAAGKIVVSGAEPEYYDFIGEKNLHPIVNAVPDDEKLYETIRSLVADRDKLLLPASQGPEFVAKHNGADVVAARHLDFWTSKM